MAKHLLTVGKTAILDSINYVSDDFKFQPGSDKALNELYQYLLDHPKLQVEIQEPVVITQATGVAEK